MDRDKKKDPNWPDIEMPPKRVQKTLWDTVSPNYNIVSLLQGRERQLTANVRNECHFTAPLLKRLHLEENLEGHQGCVNCLQWSADGRQLASGSDDTVVRIWDPFNNKCLHEVPTKHIGNIFSVKFVSDGNYVATCAGDCRVLVQSIEDPSKLPIMDCTCHNGRVKRLATAPDCPAMFWSAGEDGMVLQYDMREPHECIRNSVALIDQCPSVEFKCIAVNPTKPYLIAVGANDAYTRLYDRRFLNLTHLKTKLFVEPRKRTPEPQDPNCVQYFAPGHLARNNGGQLSFKLVATYVTFDATGNDLLVNLGGDQIYLYDINQKRSFEQFSTTMAPIKRAKLVESCGDACSTFQQTHRHNYKFGGTPCACDYVARGRRCMKREYIGDLYFAARDFHHVIKTWPEQIAAYVGLIECLTRMKWIDEANAWIEYFRELFPEELEARLFSTKYTTRQKPPDMFDESSEDVIIEVTPEEKELRYKSRDYVSRYIGHCNTTTDIKEANFMGDDGNFICAGSDDGMIFIWDRKTTNLLTALVADESIVNCVQPHPTICYVASSGIDSRVKIWSPMKEDSENLKNSCAIGDLWTAVENNQERIGMDPFDTLLTNMGFREVQSSRSATGDVTHATCRTS